MLPTERVLEFSPFINVNFTPLYQRYNNVDLLTGLMLRIERVLEFQHLSTFI